MPTLQLRTSFPVEFRFSFSTVETVHFSDALVSFSLLRFQLCIFNSVDAMFTECNSESLQLREALASQKIW